MFDLFYNLIYSSLFNSGSFILQDLPWLEYSGNTYVMDEYFSCVLALICTIVVYVACCLFIWKIIKTVGRLFSRG